MNNIIIITILFTLYCNPNLSQINNVTKISDYEKNAKKYFNDKNYDSTAVCNLKAAELYEQKRNWLSCTKKYRLAAQSFIKNSNSDTALFFLQKALKINLNIPKERSNSDLLEEIEILISIGEIQFKLNNYAQNLLCYNKALELVYKVDSLNKSRIAKIFITIGKTHSRLGNYHDALINFKKSYDINKKLYRDEDFQVARSLYYIGSIYVYTQQFDKAIIYNKKTLVILKKLFGESSHFVAAIYNSLGMIYSDQGFHNKALEYYEKALQNKISALGEKHEDLATAYSNIGITYTGLGKYNKALEYYKNSLDIHKQLYGR